MKASVRLLVTSALALAVASGVGFAEAASPAKASVSFSRGAWDRGKWSVLKSPRWNYLHGFEQLDDCIANETGYLSANYMSRVFKRYEGMTPSQYRKMVMGGKGKA